MILSDANLDHRQWLLPGCRGEGPGVLAAVEENLAAIGVPGLRYSRRSVSAGVVASLLGRRRDFLIVIFDAFPEHRVFIGHRDYGAALGVSLFVSAIPRFGRKLRRTLLFNNDDARREEIGSELDPLELSDLTALIGIVRDSLDDALQGLVRGTGLPLDSFRDAVGIPEEDLEG